MFVAVFSFISASLSINTIEHKQYWNRTFTIQHPHVSAYYPSVCLFGNCIVANRLIGSRGHLKWWVGSVEDGCIR